MGRTGAALIALALLSMTALHSQSAPAVRRAVLERGADSVKGLPFFPPNAIAALTGAYDLAGSLAPASASGGRQEASVWYSRETIVLGSAWKRVDLGFVASAGQVAYSLAGGRGSVLALKGGKYTLFFELADDPKTRAFIAAFDRKFQAFFFNANSDAELSFPAYVDY